MTYGKNGIIHHHLTTSNPRLLLEDLEAGIKWSDIESLFKALGANISEREGSRVGVKLFGEVPRHRQRRCVKY